MESRKYQKLVIETPSNNIRDGSKVLETELRPPVGEEILVKNHYSGVNATDMNIITGKSAFFTGQLPFDIGLEGMGVIEAIGDKVDSARYHIGQIGLIIARTPKTYSEYVYATPKEFVPIPELNPDYLALSDCGLTASIGLDKSGMIKSGETVLITAAAGGTGHIAVQWAKLKGCRVIGLTSTKQKAQFLESIGCDRVINYKEDNIDQILDTEFPSGIDVIWETIGGALFETLFNHLARYGRIVIVGAISGYKSGGFPNITIENLPIKLLNKSASIIGFRFRHFEHYFDQYLAELIELYRSDRLKIRIDSCDAQATPFVGIRSVVDAVEHQQLGKNLGKVVVQIQ